MRYMGREAKTATEHMGHSTTATSKLEMTATKRTKESNKPWQQLRGNSQFIFFLPTQGKSSKKKIKKEKNKYRKASV